MLKVTVQGLDRYMAKLKSLGKEIETKALVGSVNKTAVQTRNFIVKKIRENYTIKSADLKEKIWIRRANGKFIKATIWSNQKQTGSLDVTSYRYTITRRGVSVRIKKRGKATLYRGAFEWPGREGIWQRHGEMRPAKKGRYAGQITSRGPYKGWGLRRQAVRKLFGPSVRDLFSSMEILNAAREFADAKLIEILKRDLKFYIDKHMGK